MKIGNIFIKISTFFEEVKTEIKKVNWPTRKETIRYTIIVIVTSVLAAAYLGAVEFVFTTLLDKFIL